MTLEVGRLGCPPNCLCKIIEGGYSPLKVTIKEPTDMINPTFVYELNTDDLAMAIIGYSDYAILRTDIYGGMMYSETYYFITSIVSVATDIVEIHCHLDVLTSNQQLILTAIKNENGILSRAGTKLRSDVDPIEDKYVQFAGRNIDNIETISFDTPFTWTNPYYILTVAGDGSTYQDS